MKTKHLIVLILSVLLISCGKKGSLYLPDETQNEAHSEHQHTQPVKP